jgi:hypothetical protein
MLSAAECQKASNDNERLEKLSMAKKLKGHLPALSRSVDGLPQWFGVSTAVPGRGRKKENDIDIVLNWMKDNVDLLFIDLHDASIPLRRPSGRPSKKSGKSRRD